MFIDFIIFSNANQPDFISSIPIITLIYREFQNDLIPELVTNYYCYFYYQNIYRNNFYPNFAIIHLYQVSNYFFFPIHIHFLFYCFFYLYIMSDLQFYSSLI